MFIRLEDFDKVIVCNADSSGYFSNSNKVLAYVLNIDLNDVLSSIVIEFFWELECKLVYLDISMLSHCKTQMA